MTAPEQPTQVVHPAQATLRTMLQVVLGLAPIAPVLVADLGVDTTLPIVAGLLAASAVITRVMAIPGVDQFLTKLGLGARP